MTSNTIPQSIVDDLNNSVDFGEYFDFQTYSGRGMYGTECLAVITDASMWAVLRGLTEYRDNFGEGSAQFEEVTALIETEPRSESLGMGSIYYWPNTTVVDE